jgi:hypothetical protein
MEDKRSIEYVVLLYKSAQDEEEQLFIKQLVFERLNTGGIKLNHQELRNSLYNGPMNDLLRDLAKDDRSRTAWGIPLYTQEEEIRVSDALKANSFYSQMQDLEIILRFFALRHADQYRRGMQGFLDLYMVRTRGFIAGDVQVLRDLFERTLGLACDIFGDQTFHPFDPQLSRWDAKPKVPFRDAVMVGLSKHIDRAADLKPCKTSVIEATKRMFEREGSDAFAGRLNTKADVAQRIQLFDGMLNDCLD